MYKGPSDYPRYPYPQDSNPLERGLGALFALWGRNADNPFRGWVSPGGRILIKPNWVLDYNQSGEDISSLLSHASIISGLISRSIRALEGRGHIFISDAPIQSCNFQRLLKRTNMDLIIDSYRLKYPDIEFVIEDWRLTTMPVGRGGTSGGQMGLQVQRNDYATVAASDYRHVNLAENSFLEDIAEYSHLFRVTQYKPSVLGHHHKQGVHEYLVTNRIFEVDLIINVPKMKTHIKSGVTCALKNMVGINGHKEYLPHHMRGAYTEGGDCYQRSQLLRRVYEDLYDRYWEHNAEFSKLSRLAGNRFLGALWRLSTILTGDASEAGSWSGNETIWRTTLDLNHIMYFSEQSAKKIISVVDGIIAGEGDGPLAPRGRAVGLLLGGENPAYVDAVAAHLMGYNISRIPTVYHAIYHRHSKFADVGLDRFDVAVNWDGEIEMTKPLRKLPNLKFDVPKHWRRARKVQELDLLESKLRLIGASDPRSEG